MGCRTCSKDGRSNSSALMTLLIGQVTDVVLNSPPFLLLLCCVAHNLDRCWVWFFFFAVMSVRFGRPLNRASAALSVPACCVPDEDGIIHWRTDLAASKAYWHGWFEGMSDAFLNADAPKMLVIAGMDRLDNSLTPGHMQVRYELQMLCNTV